MEASNCSQNILQLLAQNNIGPAFQELERLIERFRDAINAEEDAFYGFISISARFHRIDKGFRMGLISWSEYDQSNDEIVQKTARLTNRICNFISTRIKREKAMEHIDFMEVVESNRPEEKLKSPQELASIQDKEIKLILYSITRLAEEAHTTR